MKKLSLGFLILMSVVLASCGGDNKSGDGDNSRGTYFDPMRSGQVQSVVGYIHFSQPNIFVSNTSNNGNYQNGYGYQQSVQFQIQDNYGHMNQAFIRKFGPTGVAGNQQYQVTIRGYFQLMGGNMGQVQVQSATIH